MSQEAVHLLEEAIRCDRSGSRQEAADLYLKAAELFLALGRSIPNKELAAHYGHKAEQCIARVETLKGPRLSPLPGAAPTEAARMLKRAQSLLLRAQQSHRGHHHKEALRQYRAAADLFICAAEHASATEEVVHQATTAAQAALDGSKQLSARLEPIVGSFSAPAAMAAPPSRPSAPPAHHLAPASGSTSSGFGLSGTSADGLSDAERRVLAATSKINGKTYLPWLYVDVKDSFSSLGKFEDPDGLLDLAAKQRRSLERWVRPSDLSSNPRVIKSINSASIKQTVVSDCSFVSSLAISADYERRFKKRIITSTIFPQDRHGNPVYNPAGKYLVRLFINGVWRKIVIDDRFPASFGGQLLCSFSIDPDEFWVSIIEKAYMKVMGGYDFPGSNSSIDLHALSGWIPERIALKDANDRDWERLWKGLHQGDALITVATPQMSDAESDRSGLVPTHAYALLDMRRVDGLDLIKLKNPWSHMRWKGSFSPSDTRHWTPELCRKLNYDRAAEEKHDNGEFWIDWPSLKHFYDVIYINWNPHLFEHRYSYHDVWRQDEGPAKDLYNMQYNPQYSLEVLGREPATLWVLLSRHITRIDDFADNKEYITVHIYNGGKLVYYPEDPLLQGVKINSPHNLAKFQVTDKRKLTLIVSQYEKSTTIHYTLRVFCSQPFRFAPIQDVYQDQRIVSEWTEETAGGSSNFPASHQRNPKFIVKINGPGYKDPNHPTCRMRVKLEVPRAYAGGISVMCADGTRIDSGNYRTGFCYLEIPDAVIGQSYTVIPATFVSGQVGPFFLTVGCTTKFSVERG